MSMRIMDMQVLVQKTADLAKIQQVQHQETNLRQQEMTNQIAAQTQQNTQTVNKPLANQSKLVHEKQDKEEEAKKNKKKRGNKDKEENTEGCTQDHGNRLDILA